MSESKIREVSVYKSGCIVKRQGTVHLKKGSQTVKLQGLRASEGNAISSDSVKLAVDERVTGSNIQVESRTAREVADTVRPITEKITAKRKELEVIQLQEDMWKTNSDFTNKESVSIESMVMINCITHCTISKQDNFHLFSNIRDKLLVFGCTRF